MKINHHYIGRKVVFEYANDRAPETIISAHAYKIGEHWSTEFTTDRGSTFNVYHLVDGYVELVKPEFEFLYQPVDIRHLEMGAVV